MTDETINKRKTPRYIIGFECIAQKYNPNTAFVLGKIYNLELNGIYNEFRGSMDFLANRCGLTRGTTSKIVQKLLKDNLIIDSTPDNLKKIKTAVKHYIVNTVVLFELSEKMNKIVDETIAKDRLENESKKKLLLENNSKKYNFDAMASTEINDLFQTINVDDNPFEELGD